MTSFELLCKIIASEVMGRGSLSELEKEVNEDVASELYADAKAFDMAHICGSALKKMKPSVSEEALAPFYNEFALSVFRNRRLTDELFQISELFEAEAIDHIPLKGSVIRGYYPEPWMRTSCDIDILVKKEQLSSARRLLEERLGYKYLYKCTHDITFESVTGVHLELHFCLIEDSGALSHQSETIGDIWQKVTVCEGKSHTMRMTDADLYFYNLVHMAKHFFNGGCGVKPFIDLWVLENRVTHDKSARERLVSQGELTAFLEASRKLMSVWFFGAEYTDRDRLFEKYILKGGIYGTVENRVRVGVAKRRSRISYIISRIFPSYTTMKTIYPSLQGRSVLLPFYYAKRWFRVIFHGGIKRARVQILKGGSLSQNEINDTDALLEALGFADKKQS